MELQKNNITSKTTLDSATIFGILLALIWSRYTVVTYVLIVISRLPLIGVISEFIYPATIVLLLIVLLPWMIKKFNLDKEEEGEERYISSADIYKPRIAKMSCVVCRIRRNIRLKEVEQKSEC